MTTGLLLAVMLLQQPVVAVLPPSSVVDELSHLAMFLAVGMDVGTTAYGLTKDRRVEANSALRSLHPAVAASVMVGVTGLADWQIHKVSKVGRRPRLAVILRLVVAGTHTFAAIRNLR